MIYAGIFYRFKAIYEIYHKCLARNQIESIYIMQGIGTYIQAKSPELEGIATKAPN